MAGAGDWKGKGLMGLLEKREKMVWLGRVTGAVRDVCAAWETVRDRILRFRLSLSETEGKGNVFQKNVGSWQCRDVSDTGKESAWKRGKPRAVGEDSPSLLSFALSICSRPGAELHDWKHMWLSSK